MTGKRGATGDMEARLRAHAVLHGGVVPVPFLGRTWPARGAAYWWRRIGAVVVFLVGLAVVGGMTVGVTIGIVGGGREVVRIVIGVVYDLTGVFGVRAGLRKLAEAPLDDRSRFPGGPLVLLLAPYGTGLILTMLVAMFGRDFIGERQARRFSTVPR